MAPVGETIVSTDETGLDKPDVLRTLCGVHLCQSLVRKLKCILQSHVFQNTLSALGTAWAHFGTNL